MKTFEAINKDINSITMKINETYPELAKYITEMPVTIPDTSNPEIDLKKLEEYFNSLNELYKRYQLKH